MEEELKDTDELNSVTCTSGTVCIIDDLKEWQKEREK